MLCIGIKNYFKHSGLITPVLGFIGKWGSFNGSSAYRRGDFRYSLLALLLLSLAFAQIKHLLTLRFRTACG